MLSVAEKAFMLKQGDEGVPVADICRKAAISQATYFDWNSQRGEATRERFADEMGPPLSDRLLPLAALDMGPSS
jgi:putative transposase